MKHYGKIGYRNVNYMCVIDNKFKIMIVKKPKKALPHHNTEFLQIWSEA